MADEGDISGSSRLHEMHFINTGRSHRYAGSLIQMIAAQLRQSSGIKKLGLRGAMHIECLDKCDMGVWIDNLNSSLTFYLYCTHQAFKDIEQVFYVDLIRCLDKEGIKVDHIVSAVGYNCSEQEKPSAPKPQRVQ